MLLTALTSCQYTGWRKVVYNYQKDLIQALNNEDYDALAKLFAPSVASAPEFNKNAALLLSLLPPKVVNLEDEPYGTGGDQFARTEFKITANGIHYAIAILIRHKNPDDKDEIGIVSLYVTDYRYANFDGGGFHMEDWVHGINFDLY